MNGALRLGYELVTQLARGAAGVAPPIDAKLVRALRGRRGIRARYRAWAETHRDPARPLLWVHAPSVGEGLQARPVLTLVRQRRPEVQLAYTHFSPSAAAFAAGLDVDFRDYLPFDTVADATAAIDALRPTALVFSKLDLWPTLVRIAGERGVRLGLISATLAENSSRRSGIAAALLRDAYARLDAVGAVDSDDAVRLQLLGVRSDAITLTGDTRYDQVWQRARSVDRDGALLSPLRSTRATIVAGSTWPGDEAELLTAAARIIASHPDTRVIIAPHEPTAAHLVPIERWAAHERIRLARLGAPGAERASVLLVDRVGVLGELYALADIAYVGGGFHTAGLHSVLEPAAFGAPVLFGPQYQGSRDARLLLAAGGGYSVAGASALTARIDRWLRDPESRRLAGAHARTLVEQGLGAAERSYALVDALVGTQGGPGPDASAA